MNQHYGGSMVDQPDQRLYFRTVLDGTPPSLKIQNRLQPIFDISAGGVAFFTSEMLPTGQIVTLEIPFMEDVELEVRFCSAADPSHTHHHEFLIGAKFVDEHQGRDCSLKILDLYMANQLEDISEPKEMEEAPENLRRNSRMMLNQIPIDLQMGQQRLPVIDVSPGGLSIITDQPMDIGDRFSLLLEGRTDMELECRSCQLTKNPDYPDVQAYRIGAAFIHDSPYNREYEAILEIVNEQFMNELEDL